MKCVCSECGHEQDSMDRCQKCGGFRVVLQSFMEDILGPQWRKVFLPKGYPDSLKQEDLPPGTTLTN